MLWARWHVSPLYVVAGVPPRVFAEASDARMLFVAKMHSLLSKRQEQNGSCVQM